MVTVLTTQELKAKDFLLRIKAEAPPIHGSWSISDRPVFGNYCYTWDYSHLYVVFYSFFFRWFTCVCVMICAVFLLMFDILHKVVALRYGSVYNIEKAWHATNISTVTKITSQRQNMT